MNESRRDYRCIRLGCTWVQILWSEGTEHGDAKPAMQALADVAGVRWHPTAMDVPYTVWGSEEYERVRALLGLPEPPWSDVRRKLGFELPTYRDVYDFDREHFATRPSYPHQIQGAQQALCSGGLLLGDQMGLGKTQTALLAAAYAAAHEETRAAKLIIGPLFTRAIWLNELVRLGLVDKSSDVCVLEGRRNEASCWRADAEWYFCHYACLGDWFPRFADRAPSVVIADEVHYLRNAKTARSRAAAVVLGAAPLRILLSGTPIENRPADLHPLLSMTTGKGTWGSLTDFRIRYCGATPGPFRGFLDGEPTHGDELEQRIGPYYLRRTVEDAGLVLPGFTRTAVPVGLQGKRRDMYQDLICASKSTPADLLMAIEHGAQGEALTLLHQLRVLTSDAKRATTVALLDSMREQSEPCVVFTWSRAQAEYLFDQQNHADAFLIHGGFPIGAREQTVVDFQELAAQRRPAVLFATFGALREGVTLNEARHVIFHDLDWSPASIAQAEKRIHRIGQRRACVSHWVVAQDTIDTLFSRALLGKVEHADASIGLDYGFADLAQVFGGSVVVDLVSEIEESLVQWRRWRNK